MRLAKRATEWAVVTAATMPLGVIYSVILARSLGPSLRGQYATFVTSVGILVGVLSFGAGVVARAEVASRPAEARAVHSNLFWFVVALLVALLALDTVLPESLDFGQPHWARYPLALCAVTGIYAGYGMLILQGLGRFRWVNALRLGRSVVDVMVAATLLLLLKLQLKGAIMGWTLAGGIATVAMFVVIARFVGKPGKWESARLVHSARHGWKILVAGQAIALQASFAILWLNKTGTSSDVGVFAIALGLAAQVSSLVGTLAIVASDRIAGPQRSASEAMVQRLGRVLVAVSIPILVGAALLSGAVITALYGEAFRAASGLFMIMLFGQLMSQLTEIDAQYLIAQHWKTFPAMLLNLLNLTVGIGLSFVLIPRWGAYGAATALSVGYALNAISHHVWVRRTMGCSWRELLLLNRADLKRERVVGALDSPVARA